MILREIFGFFCFIFELFVDSEPLLNFFYLLGFYFFTFIAVNLTLPFVLFFSDIFILSFLNVLSTASLLAGLERDLFLLSWSLGFIDDFYIFKLLSFMIVILSFYSS